MCGKNQNLIILSVALLLQLPPVFYGFELCDSGFYMTFYQNFFTSPRSVEYNFMYWLSGLFGGTVSVLSGSSLLAMRLFGVLVNLLTIYLAGQMMKGLHNFYAMLGGVIIVCTGFWSLPMTFYYDTLTTLLATASLLLLYKGLCHKPWLILAAGALAGVNTFSRIPNILEVGFIFLIPIYGLIYKRKVSLTGIPLFLGGWSAGIVTIVGIMAAMGHLPIFTDNMADLFSIAGSTGDEASHGMGNLIMAQVNAYRTIFPYSFIFAAIWLLWILISSLRIKNLSRFSAVLLLLAAGSVIYRGEPVTVIAAGAITVLIINLIWGRKEVKYLSWSALAMMTILPLGSDGGIYNMGTYAMILSIPAALAGGRTRIRIGRRIRGVSARWLPILCLAVLAAGIKTIVTAGVYFDDTPVAEANATIGDSKCTGIFTAPGRAALIDTIAAEIRRNVPPGETLMVYGSAPALNWLTETRPAFGNSWPEQFSVEKLKEKLASQEKPKYVLLMKFNSIGPRFGEPSERYVAGEADSNIYHTAAKSALIARYLKLHGYHILRDSEFFCIFAD